MDARERHPDRRHRSPPGRPRGRGAGRRARAAASRRARPPRAHRAELPLGVGAGRLRALPGARSARLGAQRAQSRATALRPHEPRRRHRRRTRPDARADRAARVTRPRGGSRAPGDADRGSGRPGRLRLRRVRRPPVAADLLGWPRGARGRHPQGRERPGAPDDRRRAPLSQGVLPAARRPHGPAARVLDSDHARASADGPRARRRRSPASPHLPMLRARHRLPRLARRHRTRPALPPRHRARGERPRRPLDHRPPVRGQPAHAARTVRAARARHRARAPGARNRPGVLHFNEGHPALAALELAAEQVEARRPARGRVVGCARPLRVHDAHAGARGQRVVRDRIVRRGVRGHPGAARDRRRPVPLPLSHPSRRRRVAGDDSTCAPARAPRERRQPSPRRGRTRDVAPALRGGVRRRGADHARHERRPPPDVPLVPDARAARPPPGRRVARPRVRPGDLGAGRRHPRRRALGGAERRARAARRLRPHEERAGPAAARRGPRGRQGARGDVRRGHAHARVRAADRDVQAPLPADVRPGARPPDLLGRPAAPDGRRGEGPPAGRQGEADARRRVRALERGRDHVARRVPRELRPLRRRAHRRRAATSGSTSRGRRSRRAGRAG